MKKQIRIIFITGILLLTVLCLCAWFYLRSQAMDHTVAVIVWHDQTIRTVDLSSVTKTETFTVGEPGAQNTIQISPEGICVIEADCPDQICVSQGIHAHGPEPIACLPHKLSIRFTGGTGQGQEQALDAVTGR